MGKSQLTGILEHNEILSTRIVGRAFEYYRDLYASDQIFAPPVGFQLTMKVPEVTTSEVEAAIKLCKGGKAGGPDGLTNDMSKVADNTIINVLVALFNKCLEQRKIPDEWND